MAADKLDMLASSAFEFCPRRRSLCTADLNVHKPPGFDSLTGYPPRALYRWFQPLLKLDTHVHFVQCIKLCEQETGLGVEWVRAPRLTIAGDERKQVLAIIRKSLANRPKLPKRK